MTQESIGIDTSTLVRLVTGMPLDIRAHRVDHQRLGSGNVKVFDSNQVIGEAYVSIQIHYGFTKDELDFIISYDIRYRVGRGR